MTTNDIQVTDARTLRNMADNLKADAKSLFNHNREESMRLFRLFRTITSELHRRRKVAHELN